MSAAVVTIRTFALSWSLSIKRPEYNYTFAGVNRLAGQPSTEAPSAPPRDRVTRHNDPSKRPNLRESSRTAEGGWSEGQQGFLL